MKNYETLLENYLNLIRKSNLTKKNYRVDLWQFLDWIEKNNLELETITTLELSKYKDFFEEKGYSESTINRKIASLTGFIDYLKDIGVSNSNLKNIIPIKAIPYRESEFMEWDEITAILDGIEERPTGNDYNKVRDDLILMIFLSTGMRLAEVKNIDIGDLNGNTLRVVGKRDRERFIELDDALVEKIYSYYNNRKCSETKLFLSRLGKPIGEGGLRNLINKRLDMYGVNKDRITPHAFRHTYATMLDELNVPFGTIQNILGHESEKMTSRYIHTTNKSKVNAMKATATALRR